MTHGNPTRDTNDIDAVHHVRAFMVRNELRFLFNGTMLSGSAQHRDFGPEDVEAWRKRPSDWNLQRLIDEVMLEIRRDAVRLSTGDIARATRKVAREDCRARLNRVLEPLLYAELDAGEQMAAAAAWVRLADSLFEMDSAFCIAALQHFIWQVKQKQLSRTVVHHLMPVIFSPIQGSGKTTFVLRFLGPLQELATDPVALCDIADRRSGELFQYPAIFIDDVEALNRNLNANLKSAISADAMNCRILGSSKAEKRPQRATLIGTANEPIRVLIADSTGHRRFVELPFRNGAVPKGGDAAVWQVVSETDYELLWRSVNAFEPSPIQPHLTALAEVQAAATPLDRLRECLIGLDPDSEEIQAIKVRLAVPSDKLRKLVSHRLGEEITPNAFSTLMDSLTLDSKVPFGPKNLRGSGGRSYPLKVPE